MKKSKIFFGILLVVIICGCLILDYFSQKKQAEELKLQSKYFLQNSAFFLSSDDLENRVVYHGSDELELNRIVICLYVYNANQSRYCLSLKEVVDYLSSEYLADGSLTIYSCPDSIADYVDWFNHGGDDKIASFKSEVNIYLNNNELPDYTDYTVEELQEILPLVEKAKDGQ